MDNERDTWHLIHAALWGCKESNQVDSLQLDTYSSSQLGAPQAIVIEILEQVTCQGALCVAQNGAIREERGREAEGS